MEHARYVLVPTGRLIRRNQLYCDKYIAIASHRRIILNTTLMINIAW